MNQTRRNVLRFIERYIERHTYGPTIREIAAGVGCATSSAHRHVTGLARAGQIAKAWRRARSIRLPPTRGGDDGRRYGKTADLTQSRREAEAQRLDR